VHRDAAMPVLEPGRHVVAAPGAVRPTRARLGQSRGHGWGRAPCHGCLAVWIESMKSARYDGVGTTMTATPSANSSTQAYIHDRDPNRTAPGNFFGRAPVRQDAFRPHSPRVIASAIITSHRRVSLT